MDTPVSSPPPFRPLQEVRPTFRARLARLARRVFNALLMLVAVVLVIDALFGDKGLFETLRARREHAELSAALERLRAENTRMREEARRLREDPAAIEEVARRELGMMRRGEVLFVVKDVKPRTDRRRRPDPLPR
jgi:cell division protein FtsB